MESTDVPRGSKSQVTVDTSSSAFQQARGGAMPASSPPTADATDRVTPPSSPPSPSPLPSNARRLPSVRNSSGSTWDRSTSLSSDPFGASFGASSSSHPSFSRDAKPTPTSPKPRPRKRAAPPSPASGGGDGSVPSVVMRSSSPSIGGMRRIPSTANVLARHFDNSSSDGGAPSSDDVLEAYPWSASPSSSSLVDANGVTGLGLERNLYAEPPSPTNRKSLTARKFDRTPSGTDPLAAAWAPTDSASPRRPPQQRRRIQGPSPRQSAARQMMSVEAPQQQTLSGLLGGGESEDDGDWISAAPLSWDAFWRKLIDDVFQKVDPKVVLSDRKLSSISPMIADLSKFVALDDSRSFSSSSDALMRTSSSATPGLGGGRTFSRASSSAMSGVLGPAPDSPARVADNVHGKLQFHLDGNFLTKLPSALFDVRALTFLTLRKNNLKTLPAAIGELCNLLDLNVGSNELTYLPAEIQRLSLARFTHWPNPFLKPPSGQRLEVRPFLGNLSCPTASPSLHTRLHSNSTPSSSGQSSGLMGPPALPSRLRATSRSFARTASDAEVSELLARGTEAMGTPLGARQRYLGASLLSSSTSFAHAASATEEEDSDMQDDTEASPFAQSFSERSPPPPPQPVEGVARFLGPLQLIQGGHAEGTHAPGLPTLRESCIRRILGPADDAEEGEAGSRSRTRADEPRKSRASGAAVHKPLLLDGYETGLLRELRGELPAADVRTLEAARRSANGAWGQPSYNNTSNQSGGTWCSGSQSAKLSTREFQSSGKHGEARRAGLDTAWGSDEEARGDADRSASASPRSEESDGFAKRPMRQAMNVEEELDQGDDASANPWFSRCPNPLHAHGHSPSLLAPINDTPTCDWPLGTSVDATHAAPLFAAEAARQIEWVSHIASCRVAKSGIATTLVGPLPPPASSATTASVSPAIPAGAEGAEEPVADVIPASAKSDESQLLPILWRGCSRRCLDFLNTGSR